MWLGAFWCVHAAGNFVRPRHMGDWPAKKPRRCCDMQRYCDDNDDELMAMLRWSTSALPIRLKKICITNDDYRRDAPSVVVGFVRVPPPPQL